MGCAREGHTSCAERAEEGGCVDGKCQELEAKQQVGVVKLNRWLSWRAVEQVKHDEKTSKAS